MSLRAASSKRLQLTLGSSANYFNYINMTNPDLSGMLRFLTDELQAAEDAGDAGRLLIALPPHCTVADVVVQYGY